MGVSEFKTHCLEVLESVRRRGDEIVLTKRGEAIARISPIGRAGRSLRGLLRDRLVVKGDIVQVDWTDEWEASQ